MGCWWLRSLVSRYSVEVTKFEQEAAANDLADWKTAVAAVSFLWKARIYLSQVSLCWR